MPLRTSSQIKSAKLKRFANISVGIILLIFSSSLVLVSRIALAKNLFLGDREKIGSLTRSRNSETDKLLNSSTYNGINCHLPNDKIYDYFDYSKCIFNADQHQTIFFAGDSHSDHYRQTHYLLGKKEDVQIFGLTVSSCPFPPYSKSDKCEYNTQSLIAKVITTRIKQGDLLIISNRSLINHEKRISNQLQWLESASSIGELNRINYFIRKKGAHLVLILPTPEFNVEASQCITHWYRPESTLSSSCFLSRSAYDQKRFKIRNNIRTKLDKSILVYDPTPALCNPVKCSMVDKDGYPLYVDDDHLSDYANTNYIYPDLRKFLLMKGLIS